jgi:hypothetical protein
MALIVEVGESMDDDVVNNDNSVNIRVGMKVPLYYQNNEMVRWGWIEEILDGEQHGGMIYSVRFKNQEYCEVDKQYIQGK